MWVSILGLIVVEFGAVVGDYTIERSRLHEVQNEVTYVSPVDSKPFWKFRIPELRQPPAQPATASRIADSEEVIGVMVDGQPRAYWLKALKFPHGTSSTMSSSVSPSL